ncbi:probable kinetochore protein Nuf2p [[Candida] jaroonii]|uniref:Probable kinetochore protein Nuf2p n=1 Tax=[Candida] jaroonii TaxID=467808 RepID=A0ACA9YCY4_9ASCO|nr:probable kinetochore protein Nuf2p [[Candida] jaroonii]
MSRRSSMYRPRNSTIHRRRSFNIQHDPFPILDFKEISVCLQDCNFVATEELVSKPTSQYFKSLTEQFLDTFMAISVKDLEKKASQISGKADQHPNGNDDMEGVENNNDEENKENEINEDNDTTSALSTIVLFRAANKLFQICGIDDFNLMDLMKPEPVRIRRILSAVVNFARFRETNSVDVDEKLLSGESILEKVKAIDDENTTIQNKIEEITNILHRSPSVKQVNLYNSKIEVEFKKLKKSQDNFGNQHAQYKSEKQRLVQRISEQQYLLDELTEDIEKLKECDQVDMNSLNIEIEELKSKYLEEQDFLNNLELKQKNIFIGIESLQKVDSDLNSSIRVLNDIIHDIGEIERLNNDLTKYQEILNELASKSNDLDRDIEQFKIQISLNEQKIKKLNEEAEEANQNHIQVVSALNVRYEENMKEVHRIDVQSIHTRQEVEAIENEILKTKEDFKRDMREHEFMMAKLNDGIRAHLSEMNSKI